MTFKLSTGDLCMIKYAPEAYDELNGYVVKNNTSFSDEWCRILVH